MLVISAGQEDALSRAQRTEFVYETVDLFRKLVPEYLAQLDDRQASRAVAQSMLQAETYGFKTGRQIRRFIALEAFAGRGFDQGYQFPTLVPLLNNRNEDPDNRLDQAEAIVTGREDRIRTP